MHFPQLLPIYLSVIIAGFALLVTVQQYVLNKRQLRLALFERRLGVYNAALTLIGTVIENPKFGLEAIWSFRKGIHESQFLFEPDVTAYLDTLLRNALQLRATEKRLEARGPGELIENSNALIEWFSHEYSNSYKEFAKYMDMRKAR